MFGKDKRKGVPERSRRYVIAAIVIGLVGLLASVALLLNNCWFTVGCVLPPVTATPTYLPSRTPYPATSTPLPSFTPTFVPTSAPTAQESGRLPASEAAALIGKIGTSRPFSPLERGYNAHQSVERRVHV